MTATSYINHRTRLSDRLATIGLAVILSGCAAMRDADAPDYGSVIAAQDRTPADRQTDERRKPDELLAFTGVRPGMKVLDVGAGGGYSTELLARAVGTRGVVYGQNAPTMQRARETFDKRAEGPAMKNVIAVYQPFEDPVPAGVRDLDLITFFFLYHDTVHLGVDRAKMNRALFQALKPGGLLIVSDHSARPGDGTSVTKSLHRIEESAVRQEVEAAGFRYVGEGGFLRNPADPRSNPVSKPVIPNDEFVLKFRKP
jgi:predicted methyltransferase